MDGEGTSWIRRANFSHTVCYRLIPPSIIESIPLTELNSGVKTRPLNSSSDLKSQAIQLLPSLETNGYVVDSEIQRNPVTKKQRSVSPSPQISVPDVFNEGKAESKRFSTPHPRRMNSDMGMMPKSSRKDSFGKILRSLSHSGPIRDQGTLKVQERVKSKKGKGSFKYLDYGGGCKVSSVDFIDEYCIDGSKVSYGEKFAQGLYSRLYHGKYCGEDVALKVIAAHTDEENLRLEPRLKRQFTKEATHLSRLSHPNVIKFLGVHTGHCIVTEYLPEGSLRSYLHKLERKRLPLPKLIEFALDIAKGMAYIHSKEIVHRDLKPENVLIDKDFHLKIADFGIACEAEYCDMLGDDTGTFRWMAPEMIRRRPHGRKADVYSFALVLWEMVAGAIPYEEMTPIQAAFAVVHKNIRPVIPRDCPAAMKELIELCWTLHQDRRPDFSQIVKVLEQFKASLETDESLTLLPTQICPDLKKGPKYWIHKFGSVHHHGSSSSSSGSSLGSTMPKPRFA